MSKTHQTFDQSSDLITLVHQLISILNNKEQEVINRRFGLNRKKETLAAIGEDFSVTRERIRQIQSYGLKKLQRNVKKTNLIEVKEWALQLLKESGDILSEKNFESALKVRYPDFKDSIAELKLAAILFDEIHFESNKINYAPHFRLSTLHFSSIKRISQLAIKILKKEKEPLTPNKLLSMLQEELRKDNISLRKKLLLASIKLDRRLKVESERVSLIEWRHINPKTLYDKILFILRQTESPMHFSKITNTIIEKHFDNKSVSQQAVHNELINKEEFVLVGRGVYALKEWGYKEGTVKDVLTRILEKEGPLPQAALIQKVLEVRKVKPITIQININNKRNFKKNEENLITIA